MLSRLLGLLNGYVMSCPVTPGCDETSLDSPRGALANLLLFHLGSKSALQRMVAAWAVKAWLKECGEKDADMVQYLFQRQRMVTIASRCYSR